MRHVVFFSGTPLKWKSTRTEPYRYDTRTRSRSQTRRRPIVHFVFLLEGTIIGKKGVFFLESFVGPSVQIRDLYMKRYNRPVSRVNVPFLVLTIFTVSGSVRYRFYIMVLY